MNTLKVMVLLVFVISTILFSSSATFAQNPSTEELRQEFIVALNESLPDSYLPFAYSDALTQAAQPLADSLCLTGAWTHNYNYYPILGYPWYPGGIGPSQAEKDIRTREVPAEAARSNVESIVQDTLKGIHYREIGVGVTPCGNEYTYFLFFSAQPNVIPIVINNGEKSLKVQQVPVQVTLSIHAEQVRPPSFSQQDIFGDAASQVTIQVNNDPAISYQGYQPRVQMNLECGPNTVTAKLVDARGHQIESQTGIDVLCDSAGTPSVPPTQAPATAVTVTPPNTQPTITLIGEQTVMVGDTVTVTVEAKDEDGDPLTFTVQSSDPSIATAALTGTQLTVTGSARGTAQITVTASDGTATADTMLSVTVQERPAPPALPTNHPPTNTPPMVAPIGNQAVIVGQTVMVPVTANDADGDPLTLEATSDNPAVATVTVTGSQLTVAGISIGTAQITVRASDGTATGDSVFTVTVQAPPNAPPVIAPIASQSVRVGQTAVVPVTATDAEGDLLTLGATADNPAVVTVTVTGSQLTVAGISVGTAQIKVSASDGITPSDSAFTVTVQAPPNAPPVIAPIASQSVTVGQIIEVPVTVTDADGDPLTLGASSNNPAAAGVSLNGTLLTISGMSEGTGQITVDANDGKTILSVTFDVLVMPVVQPPSSGDCTNAAQNDWKALVSMRLTWNENALTISFQTEADCIWLYPLSFAWNEAHQPITYRITADADYQAFQSTFPAAISFSGWPRDHCLQIQAGAGDGLPIPTADCPDFNKIHVTNDRFFSPLEFFFTTAVGQFSVMQNGTQIKTCQSANLMCGASTDPIRWDNSPSLHYGAPIEAKFYPDADKNILIAFNTTMSAIDISNFRIAWVGLVRKLSLYDYTWTQNGVQQVLDLRNLPVRTCLILRADANAPATNCHIDQATCAQVFVATGLTQPFWNHFESPEGFGVSVDGVNYPDDLQCPRGDDPCAIHWLP